MKKEECLYCDYIFRKGEKERFKYCPNCGINIAKSELEEAMRKHPEHYEYRRHEDGMM